MDVDRFDPAKADRGAYPGEIKVLYAGRLTREKGVDLLAESFLRAHRADPRLHLLLAGGGPEEEELRERGSASTRPSSAGSAARTLARAYASADVFLFASSTDTYGQVILEAAASGLPVVAVAEGGPAALVENRHTGLLCRPDPDHLAGALLQLAAAPLLRRRLGDAGAAAARGRSWERSMEQLAAGYRRALEVAPGRRAGSGFVQVGLSGRGRASCRSTMGRSTIPLSTSIASSPGSTSTSGFSNWPRTTEVPLLERLRFCGIYASNLDEFFMVRVAGLFDQLDAGIDARGPDGIPPSAQIDTIQARVLELDRRLHACFGGELRPALERARDQDRHARERDRGGAARDRQPLPRAGLRGADAAGDRPRPALPLHLEPLAQPRRAPARPRERGRDHRPRQGPEGAARALPAGRRATATPSCRWRR